MRSKDLVFYAKVSVLSALGLSAGVMSLYPDEGILLFVAGNFVVGALLALSSRGSLAELGLYGVFREFAGTAFLAFIFFWTLGLNATSGAPAILVAPAGGGLTPLYEPTPEGMVPGRIGWINAAYILRFDGSHLSMLVGRVGDVSSLSMGNLTVSLRDSHVQLTQEVDLPRRGDLDLGWAAVHVGEEVRIVVGGENLTLDDRNVSLQVEGVPVSVSLPGDGRLRASFGPIPMEGDLINLTGSPLGEVASLVIREDGRLAAFLPKVFQGQRTVRVTLSPSDRAGEVSGYIVVLPSAGG